MPLREPTRLDIGLHWSVAALVIMMLMLGLVIEAMDQRGLYSALRTLHMNLGLVVLVLGTWRLVRRIRLGFPDPVPAVSSPEFIAARATQWLMMMLTLLMPVSGLSMAVARRVPIRLFGTFELPMLDEKLAWLGRTAADVHESAAYTLIGLLVLHVLMAFKHHVLDGDETLRRMLPQSNRST